MRHTRSQTHQRRSHHALAERALSVCTNCKAFHLPHHMCLACGFYNGRQVMDLASERAKRDQRLKEKRERISVELAVPSTPAPEAIAAPEKAERKPKEEMQSAKGAAAKRRKDESESQESIGRSAV